MHGMSNFVAAINDKNFLIDSLVLNLLNMRTVEHSCCSQWF